MKHITKSISIVLALLMLTSVFAIAPITASAGTNGDFEYEVLDDGTAEITDYSGSAEELVIPSKLDGYTVTSIGYGAFDACTSLTSVTIPESVTGISNNLFGHCKNLTNITVNENNKVYSSLDGNLYNKDCTTLLQYALGKTDSSFAIPDSVTSIAGNSFSFCSNLANITIPDSVSVINNYAFMRCESLENITIPNSVKSIGGYGFWHCKNLKSVTIPESVTEIGYSPFGYCSNLTNITVNENNKQFTSSDGNLYNKDCTTLIQYAAGKTDSSFAIPNSVTYIGYEAFGGCSGIKNITIPNSVKSVNQAIFSDCKNLISVTIPNSITSISYCMFADCSNLTNVVIPDSVTEIGLYAFRGCASLKKITIPYSVTSIGDDALGYDEDYNKIEGFTIEGYSGSEAEKYATENDFTFISIGEQPTAPKLKKSSVSLKAGQTSTITVQNKGNNKFTYKSLNSKVATVKNGKVTALKKGKANITVTIGKTKLTYKVSVTTSPKLSKKSVSVKKGKTVTVKITGKASGVNNKYTNTKFAKIKSKKSAKSLKIQGLKKGKTTLKIKVNGVVLKLKVTVK